MGVVLILTLSVLLLTIAGVYDPQVTLWLIEHNIEWFSEFQGQTLFEGDWPGASDFAIIYIVTGFVLYFTAWRHPQRQRLWPWRAHLGFIVTSGLVTGLGIVHSLKWVLGRARPHLVLRKGMDYSEFYEFGPHFVGDGVFFGSFPSGHTAAVFMLMTLAYILIADPLFERKHRLLGWAVAAFTLASSSLMILGRAMSAHHWLGDNLATIALGWPLMHWLYFHLLKIPQQRLYFARHGRPLPAPSGWEFVLCWYAFWVTLAVMGCFFALHAVLLGRHQWMLVFVPVGIPLAMSAFRRGKRYYFDVINKLDNISP